VPVGVGFGIRDAATAGAVAEIADAVVVGSRIIEEIEQSSPDQAVRGCFALVADIRAGMDAAGTQAARRNDMSWLNKLLPPKIKRKANGPAQDQPARRPVEQVPGLRGRALRHRPGEQLQRLSEVRSSQARLEARARIDLLLDAEGRFEIGAEVLPVDRSFKDSRATRSACRMPPRHRRDRRAGRHAGLDQDPAGGRRRFRVRLHGRLDGLGARRALRARRAGGRRAGLPFICVTASGGARMQEGLFSLMQMAKTRRR
jgi:acetyl-CoA carboxylase carboxyl transferase subunit beta